LDRGTLRASKQPDPAVRDLGAENMVAKALICGQNMPWATSLRGFRDQTVRLS